MKNITLLFLALALSLATNAQCVDSGNYWNKSWQSCQTSQNPNTAHGNSYWLLYEFHEPTTIDSTHIWNANRTGETTRGINEVIVEYTTDLSNNWQTLGTYNFPQANGLSNYNGFTGPIFNSLEVQKVLLTVVSTHETPMNCASLAEVQFKVECQELWYEDIDGDGLGNPLSTVVDCIAPDNYVYNNVDNCDELVWDDIHTLFNENGCTSCHGGSGGLNLSSYASFVQGGNNCGDLTTGTTLVDIIQNGNACTSAMNGTAYANGAFSTRELEQLQAWINGGVKEDCNNSVQIKVFLEGPYNTSTGEMNNALNSANLIPLEQPFHVAPYNYLGIERVEEYPSVDIVDWVLIQARDANNWESIIESRACFLLKDGSLMEINGSEGVNFSTLTTGTDYRFAIYHKGHLGALTSSSVTIPLASSNTATTYDFTQSQTMAEGPEQTKLKGSVFTLYAGDFDNNGVINNVDFNLWKANAASVNQYLHWEVDLNGVSNNIDYNYWVSNRSKVGELNIGL